jgi:Fur family transcriptional regulator, zinc uptake regulator
MARQRQHVSALNANEKLIAEELQRAGCALGAYALIERLSDRGITAPITVYRALAKLTEVGLVHRLESLNAFVACNGSHRRMPPAFAICGTCGAVEEFIEPDAAHGLEAWAQAHAFTVNKMTVELHGACATCAPAADTSG